MRVQDNPSCDTTVLCKCTNEFSKKPDSQGGAVNLKNYNFILSITLARINILTSSFFVCISLVKTLHLTPKTLKSERNFFLTL